MTSQTFGIRPPAPPPAPPPAGPSAGPPSGSGTRRADGWQVVLLFTTDSAGTNADAAEFRFRHGGPRRPPPAADKDSKASPLVRELVRQGFGPDPAQVAEAAVARMGWPLPWWKRPFLRADWWQDTEIHPLTPPQHRMTGTSVTLGLALGVLMAAARCPVRRILATGIVDTADAQGRITPINGIAAKIAKAVGIAAGWRPEDAPVSFLVPFQDHAGKALPGTDRTQRKEAFDKTFATEIAALKARGITLEPVATLEEAARLLGATRLAPTVLDRLTAGGVAALAGAGLAGLAFQQWHDRPLAIDWAFGADRPLVRYASQNDLDKPPLAMVCADTGPAARIGDVVGIPVRVPAAADEDIAVVAVLYGDRTNDPIRTLPGIDLTDGTTEAFFHNGLGSIAEPLRVTVVAARWPTTAAAFQRRIDEALEREFPTAHVRGEGRIGKVQAYLDATFAGRTATTAFDTVTDGGLPCD